MSGVGRTRTRLAKNIERMSMSYLATGDKPRRTHIVICDPAELHAATGAWRTNVRLDTMPWAGSIRITTTEFFKDGEVTGKPITWRICSWDTMTELASLPLCADYDAGYEINSVGVMACSAARMTRELIYRLGEFAGYRFCGECDAIVRTQ